MSNSIYAVIAYAARYWFALLALVIIWRAIQWIRKDASRSQRIRSRLPDAGFIGEWVVVSSETEAIQEGFVVNAPRDGWVGSARACDIRIKTHAVPARAARFYLRKDGLHMLPRHANMIEVDGETVRKEAVLRHGALLGVGGVTLQLRLFAGILLSGEAPVKRRGRAVPEAADAAIESETGQGGRVELPKPVLTVKIRRNRGKERGATWPET